MRPAPSRRCSSCPTNRSRVSVLAQALEVDRREAEALCDRLQRDLDERGSGLVLRNVAGGWRLYTHPDTAPVVEQFVLSSRQARLTKAALETLAIVAYKQPVTRHQVSGIRGVNSDGVLRALTDRGLIEEAGRDEAPGRPLLYATTPGFLERLGLPSLASLPSLAPLLDPSSDERRRLADAVTDEPEPDDEAADGGRGLRRGPGTDRPLGERVAEERLQRALARAGFGSRRACEQLIVEGRVTVDGDGRDPGRQGRAGRRDGCGSTGSRSTSTPTSATSPCTSRPGVVTTMRDPQGRPDIRGFLPAEGPRVFPVGRLDRDSEGLLLLTNDGDLANRLMHPSHGVEKEYLAEVDGAPTAKQLARVRSGVELDDGPARAVRARIVATARVAARSGS